MTENVATGASSGGRSIIKFVAISRVADARMLLNLATGVLPVEITSQVKHSPHTIQY